MKRIAYSFAALLSLVLLNNSIAAETTTVTKTVTEQTTTEDIIPVPATAEQKSTAKPSNARLWNLQEADILSVINEVSLETGKNFIVDPRVNGKITLVSSKPIPPKDVYQVFLSVLASLGYSAIPTGDVIKVVPNMESSEYATRVASAQAPGRGDEVVVRVLPLDNVSANQMIPIIRPLLPQWSNISAYVPGNVLILTARAGNVERILTMIKNIDKASNTNIEVIPLRQASAGQMTSVLNNLQNAAKASGDTTPISIAADERTNSILLSGNKAARLHMRAMIAQLDTSSANSLGNTQVVYLRYLQAKNFAPILGKIAQNMLGKDTGSSSSSYSSNASSTPNLSSSNTASTGSTSSSSSSTTTTPENNTNIQAEPSTNALIITAPPTMMRALQAIIAKLDIRPAQVLIEGILVEINQDDLKNLGVQWGERTAPATTLPGFGTQGEGVIGIIPGGPKLQAVLSLLQNKRDINILSTPSVVVLDNHKATLDIGQDVPTQSGSYTTNTNVGGGTPFNTIAYKKVALVLTVIPQINLNNSVRMTLLLKNDTLQNPDNPTVTPIINTSQIANSVIVNSSDVLVVGGLISNSITHSVDKIPFFSDLPIIGNAFNHNTRKLQKKTLVVFLKPTIMHDATEASALTHTKYDLVRNTQINWPVDLSNPGKQKTENILPLWKNDVDLPKPFEQ